MKITRNGVFETNSSSTHCISIHSKEEVYETIPLDRDGSIEIVLDESYNWGFDVLSDAREKLKYALTWLLSGLYGSREEEAAKNLVDVVRKHTGARNVKVTMPMTTSIGANEDYPAWIYSSSQAGIDHQSSRNESDYLWEFLKDEQSMKTLIFDTALNINIGNDNGEWPESVNLQNVRKVQSSEE